MQSVTIKDSFKGNVSWLFLVLKIKVFDICNVKYNSDLGYNDL